jgi:hypothetical protein
MLSHGRSPNHETQGACIMAEDKRNENPKRDTRCVNFEESKGKTIESIEVHVEGGHYNIDINFTDNTALILGLEPFVAVFPYLGDWATGERKIIKEWKPIQSISLRE